ncbi:MAG: alkaline phosphatase family protein, partial [Candidatus Binatia bacterium]
GLYVNLAGRERFGIVAAGERDRLLDELGERLLAWKDPANGENVVARVYRREQVYSARYRDLAPDVVVGYNRGYRVSNESALGQAPAKLVDDNKNKWSGDHCIAAEEVPGVLLANRPLVREDVSLLDIAPTVLHEFSIEIPREMAGKPFLAR